MKAKTNTVISLMTIVTFALVFGVCTQAASASDGTPIVSIDAPTPFSAAQGRFVWSQYDPTGKTYLLKTEVNGQTTDVPVAKRAVPFDVDLGTSQDGDLVTVYSRCSDEPLPRKRHRAKDSVDPYSYQQDWRTAGGCRLYQFNFQTNKESKLSQGHGGAYSSVEPSIYHGKVAYISFKDGQYGKKQSVYIQADNGPAKLQKTAKRTALLTDCIYDTEPTAVKKCMRKSTEKFTDVDLESNKLAIAATFQSVNYISHLELGYGSKYKVIAYGKGVLTTLDVASPQISGNYVYFAYPCNGECDSKADQSIRRYDISKQQIESADLKKIGTIALDGTNTYYEDNGPFGFDTQECSGCAIKQISGLTYVPIKH